MTLSSLRRYVSALGARLEITVRTDSGETIRIAPPGGARNHAACTHVENRLAMAGDDSVPPGHVRTWLAEVDAVFRRIWPGPEPDFALCTVGSGSLAESRTHDEAIVINTSKAIALSRELDGGDATTLDPACGSGRFVATAFRYLAAHELGHLLPSESWPSLLRAPGELAHPELLADFVAGNVGAQLGDDAPVGAAVASRLGCPIPACTHPAPERRAAAYLAGYAAALRAPTTITDHSTATARAEVAGSGSPRALSLLVIRSSDIERTRAFYSNLGLEFESEKHGDGPLHYSCEMADTVFEIYPATRRRPPMDGLRIGLRVPSVAAAVEHLISAGLLNEQPRVPERSVGASVCVVRDPDGTTVELRAYPA